MDSYKPANIVKKVTKMPLILITSLESIRRQYAQNGSKIRPAVQNMPYMRQAVCVAQEMGA
jgi:hypothetical protein